MSSIDTPFGDVAARHLDFVLELECSPEVVGESISVPDITHAVAVVANGRMDAMAQSTGMAPVGTEVTCT
jgi:hypothetical protein